MINITVIRGDGDVPGEDIVDHLITNDQMAAQRGRNEIDADTKIVSVEMTSVYRPNVKTGQTGQVLDAMQGRAWDGKITGVEISVEFPKIITMLSIAKMP